MAGWSQVTGHGFVALAAMTDEESAMKTFGEMDDNGGGIITLVEFCEFIKNAEIKAGTEMGQLLAEDETGGASGAPAEAGDTVAALPKKKPKKAVVKAMPRPSTDGSVDWSSDALSMEAVSKDGLMLEMAGLDASRALVLAAVNQNGMALKFASTTFKDDAGVVMAAARQTWRSLQFASKNQRTGKDLAIVGVSQDPNAFQYVANKLRYDREVLEAACSTNGKALSQALGDLASDKALVLLAVTNNGMALAHASDGLKGDDEVVNAAISQNPKARKFASAEWQKANMPRGTSMDEGSDDGKRKSPSKKGKKRFVTPPPAPPPQKPAPPQLDEATKAKVAAAAEAAAAKKAAEKAEATAAKKAAEKEKAQARKSTDLAEKAKLDEMRALREQKEREKENLAAKRAEDAVAKAAAAKENRAREVEEAAADKKEAIRKAHEASQAAEAKKEAGRAQKEADKAAAKAAAAAEAAAAEAEAQAALGDETMRQVHILTKDRALGKAAADSTEDVQRAAEARARTITRKDAASPWCYVVSALGDILLAVDSNKADEAPIGVHTCKLPSDSMKPPPGTLWKITEGGFCQNMVTGLVLEIQGHLEDAKTARKTDVVANVKCPVSADDPSQHWFLTKDGEIENTATGLLLTVRGGSTKDHVEVWMNKRNKTKAQKWIFKPQKTVRPSAVPR